MTKEDFTDAQGYLDDDLERYLKSILKFSDKIPGNALLVHWSTLKALHNETEDLLKRFQKFKDPKE